MRKAKQTPDHAGDFDRRALALAELVDPAENQRVQAGGQVERLNRGGIAQIDPAVAQVVQQLLDIERVALRLRRNAGDQRRVAAPLRSGSSCASLARMICPASAGVTGVKAICVKCSRFSIRGACKRSSSGGR